MLCRALLTGYGYEMFRREGLFWLAMPAMPVAKNVEADLGIIKMDPQRPIYTQMV